MIENEDGRKFWATHFGADEYDVSWRRFSDAIGHEFFQSGGARYARRSTHLLDTLRDKMEVPVGENEITIYAWAHFVSTVKVKSGESFAEAVRAQLAPALPPAAPKTSPLNSPSRIEKSSRATSRAPTPASVKSRVMMRATTEIFPPAAAADAQFELEMFGDVAVSGLPELQCTPAMRFCWTSFAYLCRSSLALRFIRPSLLQSRVELGRAMFTALPSKYLVHISRLHCSIEPLRVGSFSSPSSSSLTSLRDGAQQAGFQLIDSSGNGTLLNGKKLQKNRPAKLRTGDRITILTHPKGTVTADPVLLGYAQPSLPRFPFRLADFAHRFIFRELNQQDLPVTALNLSPFAGNAARRDDPSSPADSSRPLPQFSFSPSPSRRKSAGSRSRLTQSEMIGVTDLIGFATQAAEDAAPEEDEFRRLSKKRKSEVESSLLEVPRPKRSKLAE